MLAGTQKPMLGMKLNRAHPLADGLVGCWLFNEGVGSIAYDSSGYGNHGTLEKMAFPPIPTSGWNPSKDSVGLAFDGSNDYINCGNDSSLNLTEAITIEAWVKPISGLPYSTLINKTLGSDYGYMYSFYSSTKKPTLYLGDANSTWARAADTPLPSTVWSHIAVTYDGIDTIKYYLNGQSDGVQTALVGGSIASNVGDVVIGGRPSFPFDGSKDCLKIYTRTLSVEEVKWLYREPYAMFERGELLL